MSFKLEGRVIFFATNNVNKFNEARRVFADYQIAVGMLRVKTAEIQNENLEEIAKTSAVGAFKQCSLPVIVEDAGLFVEALNGFPGPYAAYVYKAIGNEGILILLRNAKDRNAKFQSAIAYCSSGMKNPKCFSGEAIGEITREERRRETASGFGFDPIFKPANSRKTFAEMTIAEKNKHSHRAKALEQFAEWYITMR
jgi:XTP/dITP diphosphohydrolase